MTVQASDASSMTEGLCMYSKAESFCPYKEVIGGCPPWFDDGLILIDNVTEVDEDTVKISFRLRGKKFVEYRQPGWDWLCCSFRQMRLDAI